MGLNAMLFFICLPGILFDRYLHAKSMRGVPIAGM
jgi:hypothetical protein